MNFLFFEKNRLKKVVASQQNKAGALLAAFPTLEFMGGLRQFDRSKRRIEWLMRNEISINLQGKGQQPETGCVEHRYIVLSYTVARLAFVLVRGGKSQKIDDDCIQINNKMLCSSNRPWQDPKEPQNDRFGVGLLESLNIQYPISIDKNA